MKKEMNWHFRRKMPGVVAYIGMPLLLAAVCALLLCVGLSPAAKGLRRMSSLLMNSGNEYFLGNTSAVINSEQSDAEGSGQNGAVLPETETEEKQVVEEPNVGDQYGTLTCERLNINSPVYFGDNPDVLLMGIGTYPVSWIPGCGHTTLMSGHNDMALANLGNVAVDDCFTLTTAYGTYEYRVSDIKIVDESEVEACRLDSDTEQIVLYTCYPFYRISGRRTERFFVYLEKLSGPEIELINYFLKD